MTFFTVEEIEPPIYETYEDGEYTTEILDIEKKSNNFDGVYIEIQRQFLDSTYEGKVWIKKYKISSENNITRNIAKQDISKLAVNIAKIQPGEELRPEHVIGKITKILIRNKKTDKGNTFSNIEREELVNEDKQKENDYAINGIAGSGMQPLQQTAIPGELLNDEIPF